MLELAERLAVELAKTVFPGIFCSFWRGMKGPFPDCPSEDGGKRYEPLCEVIDGGFDSSSRFGGGSFPNPNRAGCADGDLDSSDSRGPTSVVVESAGAALRAGPSGSDSPIVDGVGFEPAVCADDSRSAAVNRTSDNLAHLWPCQPRSGQSPSEDRGLGAGAAGCHCQGRHCGIRAPWNVEHNGSLAGLKTALGD